MTPEPAALPSRPLRFDDLDAVLALMHGYDREFFGEPLLDRADLEGDWQAPSFHLAEDSLGAVDGERLVAAGTVDARGGLDVVLAPPLRYGVLEERLLGFLEHRGRSRGNAHLHRHLADGDRQGQQLLARLGWSHDYDSWILRLPAEVEIRSRELPPGYRVRPFRDDDARAVYAVVRDAFAEWQPEQRDFDDWAAANLHRAGGDPTRFRVVLHEAPTPGGPNREQLVGAAVVHDGEVSTPDGGIEAEAWVAQLAVRREHRHRGLAQRLLAETYAAARERGVGRGGLATDSRTGALGLYQRLGMEVAWTLQCWSRTL